MGLLENSANLGLINRKIKTKKPFSRENITKKTEFESFQPIKSLEIASNVSNYIEKMDKSQLFP